MSEVQDLLSKAENGSEAALAEIADIARRAQEEIIKFGHMNDMERGVLRNLVFVYSWMRGAGRYAGRFPLQHAIQAQAMTNLGEEGKEWLDRELGGVPSFLVGAIPVGRKENGDPILINPFSLNPLGTGVDIVRAASGTAKVLSDPSQFNKYAQEDVVGLLNPLIQAYVEAREGGKPPGEEMLKTIAPIRLINELKNPGSGSVFPGTRQESLGRYIIGTLYPRQASQQAITRAVERQNRARPEALIPQQMEVFKKVTGEEIPLELVSAYRSDLKALDAMKKFQKNYADDHGGQGFRNLPPKNRVEAALEYLRERGTIPEKELSEIEAEVNNLPNDAALNQLANTLWGLSGVGGVKRAWDDLMRDARGLGITPKRP